MSNADIQRIMKSINKELKTELTFGDADSLKLDRITTGMPSFDQMIGGGLPRQAVTELFGYQSSGKTYICQRAIASAQAQGMKCAFIDAEYSYEPEWAEKAGVITNDLIVSQPPTGEAALDILLALCENEVDLIVVDSIAALLPTAERDRSMESDSIGLQARLMNKLFRKLPPANKSTAVVLINQIRAGIGGYITRDALPGGKGQEFFSRIMVRIRRGESIKDEGFVIEARTEKNKTFTPHLTCSIPFYFDGHVDELNELFNVATSLEVISRSGPKYSFKESSAVGREGYLEIMRGSSDLVKDIRKEVEKVL